MLIRFAATNHRSIKEPIELSLVAVDEGRPSVRHFGRISEGLLSCAAIYGPNASGKSNILDALGWIGFAVTNSLRMWEDAIPRQPFRFAGGPGLPSAYEIEFMVGEVRHVYSLHLTDQEVLFEELLSYPERRPRQLFVREGSEVHFRRGMGSNVGIKDLLTRTTLVMSLARRFEIPDLHAASTFLANLSAPFSRHQLNRPIGGARLAFTLPRPSQTTNQLFINAHAPKIDTERHPPSGRTPAEDLEAAKALLRFADLGIDDVRVVEQKDLIDPDRTRLDLRLLHRAGDDEELFRLSEESDGTQMWFRLIGPVLAAIRNGTPLLLDEIDSSLHPILSARLLDLFRDPAVNRSGAQLIFTTHDTTLLGTLNRDEVWLTEKDENGATGLTALAEYGGDKVRRSMNLERAYLSGRFGGLPRPKDSALAALRNRSEGHGNDDVPGKGEAALIDSGQDDVEDGNR